MMKRGLKFAFMSVLAAAAMGCSSQEIPPAHKGRMFDKTGPLAFYAGGRGFEGAVLGPGTYFTAIYPEVRMVECGQHTVKEHLTALTKDGVQFNLDIYVNYSAACDQNEVVTSLLEKLSPEGTPPPAPTGDKKDSTTQAQTASTADPKLPITADQIYRTFIRPAIGEAVRESVSPYVANDVNSKRDEIFAKIKEAFNSYLGKQKPLFVTVYSLNLSNLDFPEAMDKANAERAAQAILRDKAIAEQEKVKAEIERAKLEVIQAEQEALAKAKKIDIEGAALHRNPEYYVRDVYYYAAQQGSSVMLPGDPNAVIQITPGRKK